MSPRVLVTGGTGYLGQYVLRDLCARGNPADIRVLVWGEPPRWLSALGCELMNGSVTSRDDVRKAVAGIERIYHMAGFVSHDRKQAHRMYDVHVSGTRITCEEAAAAGVKRIVMSSTSGTIAVSDREDEWPDEESATPMELIARWPYYSSKIYQEEAAKRACGSKVELVMLNPTLLLGPGDELLGSSRPVLNFLAGEVNVVPGGGVAFVDARDAASMFPVAMEKGRPGERYLLNGANMTFRDFFGRLERISKVSCPRIPIRGKLPYLLARVQAAILEEMGRKPKIQPLEVEMAQYYWYCEPKKAKAELGFAPRSPTDTLYDTVQYIREHFMGNGALKNK